MHAIACYQNGASEADGEGSGHFDNADGTPPGGQRQFGERLFGTRQKRTA